LQQRRTQAGGRFEQHLGQPRPLAREQLAKSPEFYF
jgi:hypothetical protein